MQSSEEARDALVSKVVQLKRTEENINFIQGTYTLKLYLTGDLEFVSKMYGLSVCEYISSLENSTALLLQIASSFHAKLL